MTARVYRIKRAFEIACMTIGALLLVGAAAPVIYGLCWWSFGKVPFP